MKEKRKNKKNKELEHCERAMFDNPVVSANECTGMQVTVPETNAEAQNYRDIYDLPIREKNRKHQK